MNNADRIQLVIDTLQHVVLTATCDNLSHMLGCLQELAEIRDSVRSIESNTGEKNDDIKVEVFGQ